MKYREQILTSELPLYGAAARQSHNGVMAIAAEGDTYIRKTTVSDRLACHLLNMPVPPAQYPVEVSEGHVAVEVSGRFWNMQRFHDTLSELRQQEQAAEQ